jgi:O-antigen ligase
MYRARIVAFHRLSALLPALVLALFSFACGTLPGAATALGAGTGIVLVLAMAVLAGGAPRWWDPLRLGRWGWLPWALWGWLLLGAAFSPVPRAGWLPAVLLPAYLLLPLAVAHCWRSAEGRRWGLTAVALVVLAVAAVGLWGAFVAALTLRGEARVALPLGHHGSMALWLVLLLPLVVAAARAARGPTRWLGAAASLAALLALLATRSLAGAVGLAVLAGLAVFLHPKMQKRPWLVGIWLALLLGLLPLALQVPRLEAVLTGEDASFQARREYARAGMRGLLERPWLGWGAGSTPWTAADFLRPEPGIHPPGEAVGHLHSVPGQLGYEMGFPGQILAAAIVLLWCVRRRGRGADSAVMALVAGTMVSVAGADPGVPALPVALAIVLGAGLPAAKEGTPDESFAVDEGGDPARWMAHLRHGPVVYALVAVLLLARPMVAQRHYDLAVLHPSGAVLDLRQAIDADPRFPLYRARGALLGVVPDPPAAALQAAEAAHGVAALWLLAGTLGAEDGEPWAEDALLRACELDPLAAAASYELARLAVAQENRAAVHHAARALLAEPRLAAAPLFFEMPALGPPVLDAVGRWPGVDEGLKVAVMEAAEDQWRSWEAGNSDQESDLLLTLSLDGVAAESPSLYLFHRRPWPAELATVRLLDPIQGVLELPAAPRLRSTARGALDGEMCRP